MATLIGKEIKKIPVRTAGALTGAPTSAPTSAPTRSNGRQTQPSQFRGLPDRAIITITLSLCGFGLMAIFSASAPESFQSYQDTFVFFRRQAVALMIGLMGMFLFSRYDYRQLKKWAWPLAFGSLFLLALTLVPGLGVTSKGSSRWLGFAAFQFQPSELCKLSSLVLMSAGLSQYFWWHRQIFFRLLIILAMSAIVVKQPDLGTAIIIMAGLLSLLYASGTHVYLIVVSLAGAGAVAWHHIKKTPYQMARILSWLNPHSSPQDAGWNIIQAQLAIGSGGWMGVGFGRSLQKLYYLPVQHADFIFAVIAEEFGWLGCCAVISLFLMFGYYGFKAALHSRTLFGRFLAIGITSSIILQALINIMVTTGILPVTGLTLPFISYGGTSAVITLFMVGILLSISRDRGPLPEDDEQKLDATV